MQICIMEWSNSQRERETNLFFLNFVLLLFFVHQMALHIATAEGIIEVTKDESGALIISSLAAGSFLICLVCTVYHRRKRRKPHHRQLGLHRSGGHYDSTTSATG